MIELNGTARSAAGIEYADAVWRAGGTPLLLPAVPDAVPDFVARCDAFVLTGGKDADTRPFGVPLHPAADPVDPRRQAFDTALLRALREERPDAPTLCICLGMQMMAMVAGGKLNQHLPDTLRTHEQHRANNTHPISPGHTLAERYGIRSGEVCSSHHQAVQDPGPLIVLARSGDGVIESIADPTRPHYLGVQWHPERTDTAVLGLQLFRAMVRACPSARDGDRGAAGASAASTRSTMMS